MYLNRDQHLFSASGGAGALRMEDHVWGAMPFGGDSPARGFGKKGAPVKPMRLKLHWRDRLATMDAAPDLAQNIFSRTWWRGLATISLLCGSALGFAPGFGPLKAYAGAPMEAREWQDAQVQTIAPLAYGGDTGTRMGPTAAVRSLANAPERPEQALTATLGQGDTLVRLLSRSGVGADDARAAMNLIAGAVSPSDIQPGTRIDVRLGQRASLEDARPLEHIALRARFDMRLELERSHGTLTLRKEPIAVDTTPLRIRGTIGELGLYRTARAAGAPASAVQEYLRVLANNNPDGTEFFPSDQFDIILDYKRAATGEVVVGDLLYAGLARNGAKEVQMLRWRKGDQPVWYEASGVGKTSSGLAAPVNGRLTSSYGMRVHPILRFARMHGGNDYGAPYGAPVYAVSDGIISYAGRKGGYGNFIQLNFGGGLASGYGHLSRIAVSPGQRVSRGQVLGYVGSTGLSTGPHLHYEMYRNGVRINPNSVSYVQQATLNGGDLAAFKARLAELRAVPAGAGR